MRTVPLILLLSLTALSGCNCGRKITEAPPGTGDAGVCDGERDGTPCTLWWEPCVDDAVCKEGECRSALAEAEVPGQLRWDAGLSLVSGPLTVDGAGNSTFIANLALPDGGVSNQAIYAFDACGKLLWFNDACEFGGAMSDGEQLVAWGLTFEAPTASPIIAHLFGLDPATGSELWETITDPLIEAQDAGAPGNFNYGNPAMSNVGLISIPVETEQLGSEILSLDHRGNLVWLTRLPLEGGRDPIVDADGRVYSYGGYQTRFEAFVSVLWSGSSSGAWLLDDETKTRFFGPLAAGTSFISSEGVGELSPDGGTVYAFATPPQIGQHYCFGGQIIDTTGAVSEDIQSSDATESTVFALSPTGDVNWQWQAEGLQSFALSGDGTLFAVTVGYCAGFPHEKQVLSAVDSETGTVLWQVTLSDKLLGPFPGPQPSLALTPNATLLTTDGSTIFAVFAGQERPSTTAPWSRDRGSNDNRACAAAP